MKFTWSERKRALNLKQHGLDFMDTASVFHGLTFTFEDDPDMKSASSHSEKRPTVKRASTSAKSETDWARLRSNDPPVTPPADHPQADVRHIVRGVVRRGLQPQSTKAAVSLRVDQDVLDWFKAQGPGYQTRINAVLRAFRDASV